MTMLASTWISVVTSSSPAGILSVGALKFPSLAIQTFFIVELPAMMSVPYSTPESFDPAEMLRLALLLLLKFSTAPTPFAM